MVGSRFTSPSTAPHVAHIHPYVSPNYTLSRLLTLVGLDKEIRGGARCMEKTYKRPFNRYESDMFLLLASHCFVMVLAL